MAEEIRFNELANVGELSPSAIVAIVQEQQGELVSLQCSAAQIADLIVNGIQFQALTSEDKKIIGAINEVLAKVDDLELFKFPNATIIGAPTINNGQISGFSQTSYLQFPFLMDFQGRHFAINMEFTTAADVTNQQNIFDSDFGLAFAIRSGKFVIAVSSNGTSWNIGEGVGTHTVLSNTTYRVQLAWDGTAYKLAYSVNGGESYTEDISLASTASPFPKQVYIGVGENYASVLNFFKGIINLNYASLYVADSLVWQGMDDVGLASRLATDLSNIDTAGEQRIKDIAGSGGGGSNITMAENPAGGIDLTVENQKQTLAKQEDLAAELAEIRELSGKIELPLEVGKTVISGGVRVYEDSNYNLRIPQGSNIKVKKGDTLVVTIPSGYNMTTPSLWNGNTFLGNIPNNGYEFTNDYDDIIVNIGFSNNVSAINKKDILVNYTNAFIYSYEKRFDSMDNTVSSLRNFVNDTIDGSPEIHSEDFTFTVGKFFNINSHSIMSASGYAVCEINISSEYDAIYVKSNNMTGTAIRPIVFYDGTNYTTWGEYNTAVDTVVDIPSGTIKAYITVNSNSDYKSYFVKKGIEGVNDKINYLNDTVNPLKGKKIAFFGDSIVGTNYTTPTWWQYIEQLTGCIPTNYGVSGTSIAYHSDRETTFGKCFANRYSEMANDFDAVVVMGGTNDIDNVTGTPLGSWNDNVNTTLFGALNILIKGLFNKYNGKPIIFCTPISRNYANNSSDVNVLDPLTVLSSKSPTDTLTGQLVAEAIKAKCRQYGMRYIDMQACGITGSDEAHEYFRPSDSYHPSELGQKVIANTVLPYLENCFRI